MAKPTASTDTSVPLCVDLDGTLIYSDVLYEVLLILIRKNLFYLLLLPIWVLKGKAHFKHQIAEHCELDPAQLPYNQPLLDYLKEQRRQGRPLVLATATHKKFAGGIADFLGIFDRVLASDADINLSGHRKLHRLKQEYGSSGFDYAGNGHIDLDVWPETRRAIVVNPDAGVLEAAEKIVDIEKVFPAHGRTPWYYLHSLRLLHWAKNTLLFIPLLAAQQAGDPGLLLKVLIAFLAFSLCSSAAYLINDLLDLPSDRSHQRKQHRPLAASTVPLLHGLLLVPVLLLPAALLCLWLPLEFFLLLVVYLLLNAAYSLWLKHLLVVDVLTLAALYLLRLLAGAAAIAVIPSPWLLGFSALLFSSMAAAKRYAGLFHGDPRIPDNRPGRQYRKTLAALGIGAGLLAALILAHYASVAEAGQYYGHPIGVWILSPLLVAWVARLWVVTRSGRLYDDPVVFALTDRVSQVLVATAVVTWLVITI